MIPFQTLLVIDKKSSLAIYRQIANGLIGLIRDGVLAPGAYLPGSREMAFQLQVHRKTIVAAYQELFTQDWVETIPRKGVRVSAQLPELKPRSFKAAVRIPAYAGHTGFVFNSIMTGSMPTVKMNNIRVVINDGLPDARIAPIDLLLREYRSLFNNPAARRMLMYGDWPGSTSLRTAIVQYLSETRGLNIGIHNVLMTRGAQMAIFIAGRLILKPGATVLVGEPGYYMADKIFQQFGATLMRVPVDENGMDIDAVARICKKRKPDLLYIIPHHHHPTTVTLSANRRMKLLELIREYNLPVIEDDYDYDYHYSSSPILPLASADHGGNVMYIGSLTKSLASSLRIGYLIAPENFIQEAARLRMMMDIRGDILMEEALAVLYKNGDMQRHLKKSVKLYHERRNYLCHLLQKELGDAVHFSVPAGGMAIWVCFHKKYPLPVIAARASELGLFMSNGNNYSTGAINYNGLRIGFASLNEKETREMVGLLKNALPI